jgi:hypothetical protein
VIRTKEGDTAAGRKYLVLVRIFVFKENRLEVFLFCSL